MKRIGIVSVVLSLALSVAFPVVSRAEVESTTEAQDSVSEQVGHVQDANMEYVPVEQQTSITDEAIELDGDEDAGLTPEEEARAADSVPGTSVSDGTDESLPAVESSPGDVGAQTAVPADASEPDDASNHDEMADAGLASDQTGSIANGTIGTCSWSIDSNGVLRFTPASGAEGELGVWSSGAGPNDHHPWSPYRQAITAIEFEGTIHASTCVAFFIDLENVTYINLENLDTSKVTDMRAMFSGCSALQSIDLAPLDTSSVTLVDSMFARCSSLQSINLDSVNMSRVTSADSMFSGCSSLQSIDLAMLEAATITSFRCMFAGCSSLRSIDLAPLHAAAATNMSGMFFGCSSLISVNLSPLNMSQVKTMDKMFTKCLSLTEVSFEDADTQSVEDVSGMFAACPNLVSIDLSALSFPSLEDASHMFSSSSPTKYTMGWSDEEEYGSALQSVNLAGVYAPSLRSMTGMFSGCAQLISAGLPQTDPSPYMAMDALFSGCSSLETVDLSPIRNTELSSRGAFNACGSLKTLTIGGNYLKGGASSFPYEDFEEGSVYWWSDAGQIWLTTEEIASEREGIADTYHMNPAGSISIEGAVLSDVIDQPWCGSAIEPKPSVMLDGKTLAEGKCYDIAYTDNVAIGTASFIVTGKGPYTGTLRGTFAIVPADLSFASFEEIPPQRYTGARLEPAVAISMGGSPLDAESDYTISYFDNVDVGTAVVSVTGKGNYTGEKSVTFKISGKSISGATVSSVGTQRWTGDPIKPTPTVKDGTKTLKNGTDYKLSYKNNKEPGTATITVTGYGNYAGTKSVTFRIGAKTGTWRQSGGRWWYQYKNGTYPASRFADIDGGRYYFDASGYMVTGWRKVGSAWYYFRSDGRMGANDWAKSGSKWCYIGPDGKMVTGWKTISGKTYWMDASGYMATGWKQISGKWYYFESSGAMAKDKWVRSGSRWCYLRADGTMATGWLEVSGKRYWMDASGYMATGWKQISGKWYYFESSGAMAKDKWVGNYYLQADGTMAVSKWIGNYHVDATGKWDRTR